MKTSLVAIFTALACTASPLPAQDAVSTPKIANLTADLVEKPKNAQLLADRGFAYAMLGESRSAIADFENALKADAKSRSIRYSYGWALFNLRLYEDAIKQWQDSIKLHNKTPWWAPHTLALGYWAIGKKSEALQMYDKAAADSPEKFATWNALQDYTNFWTWEEKQNIYRVFDGWSRAYKSTEDE